MKGARFVAPAREEFLAEVAYYDQVKPGQGARFAAAVEEATARALAFPLSGSPSEPARHSAHHRQEFPIFHRLSSRDGWNCGLCSHASIAAARVLAASGSRALECDRKERCAGGAEPRSVRPAIQIPAKCSDDDQLRLHRIGCAVIVTE